MGDTQPLPAQPPPHRRPGGPPPHPGVPQGGPRSQQYPPQGGPPPHPGGPQGGPPPYPGGPQGGPPPQYDRPQPPPGSAPPPTPRRERSRDGSGARRAALVIHTIADVAAAFLVLWIVFYLLDANQANIFVDFVHGLADWLGWWARDIFTMDNEGVRVFLNYGLPALVYVFIGHGISAKVRHL